MPREKPSKDPAHLRETLERSVILVAGENEGDNYIEFDDGTVFVAIVMDVTGMGRHPGAICAGGRHPDAALEIAHQLLEKWTEEHYPDAGTETFDGLTWELTPQELADAIEGTSAEQFVEFAEEDEDEEAIVTIGSDSLGEEATDADLEGYRANLEEHLSERFGLSVTVRTENSLRTPYSDNPEIDEYVRHLHSTDGWIEFLPGPSLGAPGLDPVPDYEDRGSDANLVGFSSWRDVIEYAGTGGPLYYKVPLNHHPTRLRPTPGQEGGYETRARSIKIWPYGSTGRGRNRTADPFTADSGHLGRFLRPDAEYDVDEED